MAWDYIVAIIIGMIVVIAIILFSTTLKEKIVDGAHYFITKVLGR